MDRTDQIDSKVKALEKGLVTGQYALLTLSHVANWKDIETVSIHLTDVSPEEIEAFAIAPPAGLEIESHATYRIETEKVQTKQLTDYVRSMP